MILIAVSSGISLNNTSDSPRRIISSSQDNSYTFIRYSNGKLWKATGENIQNAIWDLNSTIGGTIWLPKSRITIDGIISLSDNIIIEGNGAIIQATEDVGSAAMFYGWNDNNIIIRNLILDANNVARRTLYLRGDSNIEGLTIENVETKNTTEMATHNKGNGI